MTPTAPAPTGFVPRSAFSPFESACWELTLACPALLDFFFAIRNLVWWLRSLGVVTAPRRRRLLGSDRLGHGDLQHPHRQLLRQRPAQQRQGHVVNRNPGARESLGGAAMCMAME